MSNLEREPVIDGAVLASLRELGGEDDPGLFVELLDLFLADSQGQLDCLRRALAQGDMTLLERTAHTLKSSSANVGALRFSSLCAELERAGRGREPAPAAGLVAALSTHYAEVREALENAKDRA